VADQTIIDTATHWPGHTIRRQVVINATTAYIFYYGTLGGQLKIQYKKTTDAGLTWGAAVALSSTGNFHGIDLYYARWTSAAAANVAYIGFAETYDGKLYYMKFNFDTDTLDVTQTEVVDLTGTFVETLSIVYARNGDLFMTGRTRAGAALNWTGRSQDDGATWSAVANLTEGPSDQILLWPDFSGATDDILGIFWDWSANAVTVKQLDTSADNVTETAIASSVQGWGDGQSDPANWGMTLNSSGVLYLALADAWTNPPTSVNVTTYTVNGASVTAKTNVLTTTGYVSAPYLSIDPTGLVRCFYGIDPENASRESQVYAYKSSDDDMATWSAQTIQSDAPAGQYWITSGIGDPLPKGIILPTWFDETTNYFNALAISLAALVGSLGFTFTLGGTLTGVTSAAPPIVIKCKPLVAGDIVNFSVRTRG